MKIVLSFAFLLHMAFCQAQRGFYAKTGIWGVAVNTGAITSRIYDLKSTLIREWYPDSTYTFEDKYYWGYTASFAFYYRWKESALAFQPEVSFTMQGSHIHYADSILLSQQDTEGLDYNLRFRYRYINFLALFKIYFLNKQDNFLNQFHLIAGPRIGINIAPTNITYISNKPYIGPDLQIQQNLRGVLKGKTVASAVLGLGYHLSGTCPFNFEFRTEFGFSDNVETLANGYNFIENRNPNLSFQLTVGYTIPFHD